MNRIALILLTTFMMFSCNKQDKDSVVDNNAHIAEKSGEEVAKNQGQQQEKEQKQNEIDAQKWLEKSIENYFKEDDNLGKNMMKMTTKDYYQYKMDAMNVDMDVDGSLTLKEFQNKWHKKFDVKNTNFNSGFLISGQDWDHVVVEKCNLELSSSNDFIFDVVLLDKGFKTRYPRKITVIKNENQFLIADVKE